jgi:hypothetical protein
VRSRAHLPALRVPVELAVDRVRDGRSFATRRVLALQRGRGRLAALRGGHGSGSDASYPDQA